MLVLHTNNVSEHCMISLHFIVIHAYVRGWGTHRPVIGLMIDDDND